MAHYVEATAAIGLNRLSGVEKKAEIHRLKKLERDSSKLVADAKRKYGSNFSRSWSTLNLHDMAKNHGLEMHYDFYRLASQVLHGSAGGRLGSMKVIDSWPVYRIGPALSLLPMALLEGVTAFRKIVDAMKTVEPLFDPAPLVDGLDTLFRAWPFYGRLMRELDRELWPDRVPEDAHAVLGISKQGTRRWFLYEPELGLLMKATPPNPKQLTKPQREQI